ncbi:phosphoribosyltransferase [Amycolatopsis pigmentata]|uniref:Phosphoribosyltransferase n=1 Tax=Amycolatopsis pigmentata TaxID=450801 RepID=A0ABW5FUQ6_9PSEU
MNRLRPFPDRRVAGLHLGECLRGREWHDPLVLGLARGGVVVAHAVAETLDAPLDVLVARKIGAPGHPEFGVGAVTARSDPVFDERGLAALGLTPSDLAGTRDEEQAEACRREAVYLDGRGPLPRAGRDVIVVDDGLATGVTATAALREVREDLPRTLCFAAPVGSPDAFDVIAGDADEVICPLRPPDFRAVGEWFTDFRQITDEEVVALLG